jgi:hypothetical protein
MRDVTDQALSDLQSREDAILKKLDARNLQFQDLSNWKASTDDLQRAQADITALQRSLEEFRTSKSEAVDKLLALSQQKQEDALALQEQHHVAALRVSNEAGTAALSELAKGFVKDVAAIAQDFRNSLAETNRETVIALREVGAGVQASIASVNSLAVSNQHQFSELSSFMHEGFKALVACEQGRSAREEARLLREEEREVRAEQRMQRLEEGENARLEREERRDKHIENVTNAFRSSLVEVRIFTSHISFYFFIYFIELKCDPTHLYGQA